MDTELTIEFARPPAWEMIDEVRGKIARESAIGAADEDALLATTMATSELLENALKYGYHGGDAPAVRIDLRVRKDRVQIDVSNAVQDQASLERCKSIVTQVRTGNPEELYNRRLLEIAMDPAGAGLGRLGLYRIAYEGNFDLDYRTDDRVLTITATRAI